VKPSLKEMTDSLGKPGKIKGSHIKTPLPLGYLSRSLPNLILSKNNCACQPTPICLSIHSSSRSIKSKLLHFGQV